MCRVEISFPEAIPTPHEAWTIHPVRKTQMQWESSRVTIPHQEFPKGPDYFRITDKPVVDRPAITRQSSGSIVGKSHEKAGQVKVFLAVSAIQTIEPDGLRSGRNWGMATIPNRLDHMTATQRLGSIR
jgi:hypothetical protein